MWQAATSAKRRESRRRARRKRCPPLPAAGHTARVLLPCWPPAPPASCYNEGRPSGPPAAAAVARRRRSAAAVTWRPGRQLAPDGGHFQALVPCPRLRSRAQEWSATRGAKRFSPVVATTGWSRAALQIGAHRPGGEEASTGRWQSRLKHLSKFRAPALRAAALPALPPRLLRRGDHRSLPAAACSHGGQLADCVATGAQVPVRAGPLAVRGWWVWRPGLVGRTARHPAAREPAALDPPPLSRLGVGGSLRGRL